MENLVVKSSFGKSLITVACLSLVIFFASEAKAQRLAPPDSIKCDHNHLTSFTGKVLSYRRRPGLINLRMRTDEETSESFTLRFRRSEDASQWFLLKGEAFKQSDWALIERPRYRLRPRMRATVWVCDDGSNPVIDWRPGEGQTKTVY